MLLSICIPTYNRAEILKASLESLTAQDVFLTTDKVEIVISDNCSSDSTADIVASFQKQFGDKIKYHRNDVNNQDLNFIDVLSLGRGNFLKLANDTLIWQEKSLEELLNCIQNADTDKTPLCFTNKKGKIIECNSIDELVTNISFLTTWMGCFGIWKKDMNKYVQIWQNYAHTRLGQTYVLLKMIADNKGRAIICNFKFCKLYRPSITGNYNLSEVFIKNYLQILKPFVSSAVFNTEKYNVLVEHVLPRQFNLDRKYDYSKKNFWNYTQEFHSDLRFYIILLNAFLSKYVIGFRISSENVKLYLFGHKILSFKRKFT